MSAEVDKEVIWATSTTGEDFQCVHVGAWRESRERIVELEAALDDLHMHGVEREYQWMMVPKVEWDQVFKRAGLRKSTP